MLHGFEFLCPTLIPAPLLKVTEKDKKESIEC